MGSCALPFQISYLIWVLNLDCVDNAKIVQGLREVGFDG